MNAKEAAKMTNRARTEHDRQEAAKTKALQLRLNDDLKDALSTVASAADAGSFRVKTTDLVFHRAVAMHLRDMGFRVVFEGSRLDITWEHAR